MRKYLKGDDIGFMVCPPEQDKEPNIVHVRHFAKILAQAAKDMEESQDITLEEHDNNALLLDKDLQFVNACNTLRLTVDALRFSGMVGEAIESVKSNPEFVAEGK